MQPENPDYSPEIVVETEGLSEEDWLLYRKQGIGGSDAAAVIGASPFSTARDVYYDKLDIVSALDSNDNWVAKEVGHRLEALVAKIFHVKTGYRVYPVKKLFRHPLYPYMLANLDYLVELPGGETAILECKTTNYHASDFWWDGIMESVPANYEIQGRHYMAVMNLERVYFCCLYGNNENEVFVRRIDRDRAFESELITLEGWFWNEHVIAKSPPDYTEDGDLVLESVRRHFGATDQSAPEKLLESGIAGDIALYLDLHGQKSALDKQANELESRMKRIRGTITDSMGTSVYASCEDGDTVWAVRNTPVLRPMIDKDSLIRLKERMPEVYDEYVTVSKSPRFSIKAKPAGREAA